MKVLVAQSCPTLTVIPWTVAHQAPLSVEFSRQEYWSGLTFPSPGDLPDPRIEPSSALQTNSLPSESPGKPWQHLQSVSMPILLIKMCRYDATSLGTSLVVQWLRLCLPMQGVRIHSLFGDLRSHMPCGPKSKTEKRSNIVTNSIKIFKNFVKGAWISRDS